MSDQDPRQTPRRRRRWPLVLGTCLLLVAIWGVAAAMQLRTVQQEARRGIDRLDDVRAETDDLMTLLGTTETEDDAAARVTAELDAANADLASAHDTATGPVLAPVGIVPVFGRQLRAVTALLEGATQVTGSLGAAVEDLSEIAERPAVGPDARLAAISDTQTVLRRLRPELEIADLGPTEGLLNPVAEARNEFTAALQRTRTMLDGAIDSAAGVEEFLRGPTTYLVLAANNAEMRSGSGMFLQVGTLSTLDGRIELSEFLPTSELVLDVPGATLDPDIEDRWGALEPNRDWRNLNLSPRFDDTARMAAEMWASSGRGSVDGVMSMDVDALRQLLELTGPVEVDNSGAVLTLDAGNVWDLMLREQYLTFGDTDDRRELLARVLAAGFRAFNERPIPVSGLVRLLDAGGAERHVLMWSTSSVQQDAWVALGVSGIVPDDALLLALINRGGNKLDPYVEMTADLQSTAAGDHRRVRVRTTIVNLAPAGLPLYAGGPLPISGAIDSGDYIGILSLTVPGSATEAASSAAGFAVLGDDGSSRVIGVNVAIPREQSIVVDIEFDLPLDVDELQVVPSARIPATSWTAGALEWGEYRPLTIALDDLD